MREHRAVARLLGLWVRIPPGAMISVSSECFQVEVFASGSSLVQRGLTEGHVSEYEREASTLRRLWPTRGCCAMGGRHSEPVEVPDCNIAAARAVSARGKALE